MYYESILVAYIANSAGSIDANSITTIDEPITFLFRVCAAIIVLLISFEIIRGFLKILNCYENGKSDCGYDYEHLSFMIKRKFGKGFKEEKISIKKLKKETQELLNKRIQDKLLRLYDIASNSERALQTYRDYSYYLESVMDDIKNAVNACENELMEEKLIERIDIVEDNIGILRALIQKDITDENLELKLKTEMEQQLKRKEDAVRAKTYYPFEFTQNLNKLL